MKPAKGSTVGGYLQHACLRGRKLTFQSETSRRDKSSSSKDGDQQALSSASQVGMGGISPTTLLSAQLIWVDCTYASSLLWPAAGVVDGSRKSPSDLPSGAFTFP